MFRFIKWLFDPDAAVRPGCFTQVTLLFSAMFAMLAIVFPFKWLLVPQLVFGFAAVLFALPAWNAFLRSERKRSHVAREAEIQEQLKPESVAPVVETDAHAPLRAELRTAGQTRALQQLQLLLDKHADFESVLNHRFEESEVTWHRYHDSARRVLDGGLLNLESIAAFGMSLRSVDKSSLVEQLDVMLANGEGESRAAAALRERIGMVSEGEGHIEALLDSNEEALTALTRVSTRLAGINTQDAAHRDMDAMIDDLDAMAERTQRYNTSIAGDKPVIELK